MSSYCYISIVLILLEVWAGEVTRASGTTKTDYTTTILIQSSAGLEWVSRSGGGGGRALTVDMLPPLPFSAAIDDSTPSDAAVMVHKGGLSRSGGGGGGVDGEGSGVDVSEERRGEVLDLVGEASGAGAGVVAGPVWLVGGTAEGRGQDVVGVFRSTPSVTSVAGREGGGVSRSGGGKLLCDLADPDMLPASLAASRQRQGSDIRERGSRGEGGLRVRNINTLDMDVDVSIKAGRRKGGGRKERDLDQSLESISLFRQSHMGRLGLFGDEQSFLGSGHNEDFAAAAAAAQQQLLQEQLQQPDRGFPQNQPAPRPPAKFPFASASAYETATSADTDSLAELLSKQTAASARTTKCNVVGLLAPSHAAHRGANFTCFTSTKSTNT